MVFITVHPHLIVCGIPASELIDKQKFSEGIYLTFLQELYEASSDVNRIKKLLGIKRYVLNL